MQNTPTQNTATTTERNGSNSVSLYRRLASGMQGLRDKARRFNLEEFGTVEAFLAREYFLEPRKVIAFSNELVVLEKRTIEDRELVWSEDNRKRLLEYRQLSRGEGWFCVEEIDVRDNSSGIATLLVPYSRPLNGTGKQMTPLLQAKLGDRLSVREARFAGWEEGGFSLGERVKGRCVVDKDNLRYVTNNSYKK
jgi:hypothetical protein|tara:strand:+ start:84581 stop:85162 length:582 start_codon:yes stop_codon:yes gene_type:complete